MAKLLRRTLLLLMITLVGGCGESTTQPVVECDPADPACNPTPVDTTTAPLSVTQVSPTDGADDVALSATVSVTFNRPVAESSVTEGSFSLGSVDGTRTVSGATVTFAPASELTDGVTYTLSVSGVTDTGGVGLASPFTSSFTTERIDVSADAGADFDASVASTVTLDRGASAGTGATFTWAQISGPDVGTLSGDSPTFTAPDQVTVLGFELTVSDGATTDVDSVRVWILEDADQAIWVSPAGSSSSPGTRSAPLGSIQEAIDAADNAGNGADVYVAAGAYVETLTLRSRVSVYGGFDPESWERDVAGNRPVVTGEAVAVRANAANDLTFEGLEVVAADATQPGGSSIAVLLDDSDGVRLLGNVIRAGAGAPGVDGASPDGFRAARGAGGARGGAARLCVSRTAGGTRGVNYRDGGNGGLGGGTNPTGGANAEARSSGGGGGGAAGTNSSRNGRSGGDATANGSPGANGNAGVAFGAVDADGSYIAESEATSGARGGTGYGGGGGGGAHGFLGFCGGSGGGGGGGGQGGAGASPGTGGGASFAVLLVGLSVAEIAENDLQTSVGGNGGSGGTGQLGGLGGDGASGGIRGCDSLIPSICTGTGGSGGDGSPGGRGGHGGGGGGGPSIAVVEGPDASLVLNGNVVTLGGGGAGGSSQGNAGPAGESVEYKKIN